MKVIFLDVDGVLNSDETCFYFRLNNINMNGYGGFFKEEDEPINANVCWGQELVDNLRDIVEATGAEIVISSTWRITHSVSAFIKMFEVYGWNNAPVIDKTIRLHKQRGYEIQDYLKNNPNIEKYVILDDSSDMLEEQLINFVKTDAKRGLSTKDKDKAIKILGNN